MREIENCDYKAQEIKHLQFQLNLAKQELDNALAELAAHKAMVQKMKCCMNCDGQGDREDNYYCFLADCDDNLSLWRLKDNK